jgi:hypothetical protein
MVSDHPNLLLCAKAGPAPTLALAQQGSGELVNDTLTLAGAATA